MVRIRRFHRRGRGSIPRMGDFFSFTFLVSLKLCLRRHELIDHQGTGGSVVECSPATKFNCSRARAARVRFPAGASLFFFSGTYIWGRKKQKISPAGNRTPVFRVTGGDTYHYTTEDPEKSSENTKFLSQRPLWGESKRYSHAGNRTPATAVRAPDPNH